MFMHFVMCLSKGLGATAEAVEAGLIPAAATFGFIPTASAVYDDPYFVDHSRQRLALLGHRTIDLGVEGLDAKAFAAALDEVDALFVADGNVFFLLDALKRDGLDQVITERVRAGMPYFGEGAGAMLASRDLTIATDVVDATAAPGLYSYTGLGLINFFPLPQINRPERRDRFEQCYERHRYTHKIVRFADNEAVIATNGFRDEAAYRYSIVPSRIDDV